MNEDDTLITQLPRAHDHITMTSAKENVNQFPQGNKRSKKSLQCKEWLYKSTPIVLHYVVLFVLALLTWVSLWFVFGNGWDFWRGKWFRLVLVALIAWAFGIGFSAITKLPQMLAPLILGIFVRNVGFLDMREFAEIDVFLRKIFPAIILGKGPLLWNLDFMTENWIQIACLGGLPWLSEVCTMIICAHYILGHSWLHGLQFGCLFATLSGPVLIPVVKLVTHGYGLERKWLALIGSAGGIDVTLSVGAYGMVTSYIMAKEDSPFLYFKLILTPLVGLGLGIAWGYVAGALPHNRDYYVSELRVLMLVVPGSFANFFASYFDWGGCSAIGILVCSCVAANQWVKKGWNHHENPAVKAYRIMWAACEPVVFVYTGTYFVFNETTFYTMKLGIAILIICVTVRLIVASLVCWNMTWREKLFVCCCWPCKTVVQTILSPVPLLAILTHRNYNELTEDAHTQFAEQIIVISIMAVLITTPTLFLAVKCFGPKLLRTNTKEHDPPNHETR